MNFGNINGGMHVHVSPHVVKRVENWPQKKRSRRLYKKLTKKRGPQFTDEPAAMIIAGKLCVHPLLYAEMKRATSDGSAA